MNNFNVENVILNCKNGAHLYDAIVEAFEFVISNQYKKVTLIHNEKEFVIDMEKIINDILGVK